MPDLWLRIGKSIDASGAKFDKILAATAAIAASTEKLALGQEKFLHATSATSYAMEGLGRHTAGVARSLAEGAASLLKWASISGAVGGLLGVGGLWGLDRLAGAAGGARRSALGLGLTSGAQQAFGINFGRIVDSPGGLLESIANAQADPRQAWPLLSLGVRGYGSRDPAQVAAEVLDRIRTQAKATPANLLGPTAEARGWTNFASLDEIRRMAATPNDEWVRLQQSNAADRRGLALDPDTQRKWQDFNQQLGRAGQQLENVLIAGLVPLAGPLQHLSAGVVDVVKAFAASPLIGKWIGEAGDGLERFSKFIDTPEFAKDVDSFVTGVGRMAAVVGNAAKWLYDHLPASVTGGQPQPSSGAAPTAPGHTGAAYPDFKKWVSQPGRDAWDAETWGERMGFVGRSGPLQFGDPQRVAKDYFSAQGWDAAHIAAIMANFSEEAGDGHGGWNIHALNPKGGAAGLEQWLGPRKKQFESIFGVSPDKATLSQQLDFFEYELETSEKNNAAKFRAAKTASDAYDALRRDVTRPSAADLVATQDRGRDEANSYYGAMPHQIGASVLHSPAPLHVVVQLHTPTSGQWATGAQMAAVP